MRLREAGRDRAGPGVLAAFLGSVSCSSFLVLLASLMLLMPAMRPMKPPKNRIGGMNPRTTSKKAERNVAEKITNAKPPAMATMPPITAMNLPIVGPP